MRRVLVLAALLLAPTLVAAAAPSQAQAPGGPAWWNEDWPFRAVVEAQGTVDVPGVSGGTSDLVGYEIVFEDVLEQAGWPASLTTRPDLESLAVVPYESLGSGAEPGDPLPRRVLNPVSSTGTCDENETSRCLVTWERVPSATGYGIYWAPPGWDVQPPDLAEPPRMVGPIMGHENWLFLDAFTGRDLTLLVSPIPNGGVVETRQPQGWQPIFGSSTGSSDCSPQGTILVCNVPATTVRVLAPQPVVATVHAEGSGTPATPLVGQHGPVDDRLVTTVPEGSFELSVWAHDGSCTPDACQVDVNPAGGGELGGLRPHTEEVNTDGPTLIQVQGPSTARLHASIRGGGFLPLTPRDDDGRNVFIPVVDGATISSTQPTQIDVDDLTQGQPLAEDRDVEPPFETLSLTPDTQALAITAEDPVQAAQGDVTSLSTPLHQPLLSQNRLVVPDEARLIALVPAIGEATNPVAFEPVQGREPSRPSLRLSAGGSHQVLAPGDGPAVVDATSRALVGYAAVAHPDGQAALAGQALGVRHPVVATLSSAAYQANAASVSIQPGSAFAGSGSVVDFNVTLTNRARTPSGSAPPLELALDLQPVGVARDLDIETTIGATSVQLPGRPGATKTVPLSLRVPDGVENVVLEVQVNANVTGDQQLTASDVAQVNVVTIRDFELTFADGSDRQTQTAEPGGENVFDAVVRNTGTRAVDVKLTHRAFSSEGFDTCLALPEANECTASLTVPDVEPGHAQGIQLRVTSPDKEDEDRVDVLVRGELANGGGPTRTLDATALLNVPVAAALSPGTDGIALAPGETLDVPVTIENQGVQATGTLRALPPSGPLNASLVDPDSGQPTGAREKTLGPRDTKAATWQNTVRVHANETAPPGLTTEVRLELTLEPTGGLPPARTTATIPLRVLRVITTQPLDGPSMRAGATRTADLPLQVTSLKDSTVQLRVSDAPPLWNVDVPGNLTFDSRGRAALGLTVETPPGAESGTRSLTLQVLDPLGPGGDLRVNVHVESAPNARVAVPADTHLALGDDVVWQATVHNVGNEPFQGSLDLEDAPGGLAIASPALGPLGVNNRTRVPVTLSAQEAFNGTLTVAASQDGVRAGNATVHVRADEAALSLSTLRTPQEPPTPGELYPVTATVINDGPAPVRNLTLALVGPDGELAHTDLARLGPGDQVPVTIRWVPEDTVDTSQLSIVLDPQGRIIQDDADDRLDLENRNETPFPAPLALLLVSLALPARLRSFWRLSTRRERALVLGGLLLLVILVPLLFVPTISLERGPAVSQTPDNVVDSDGDGVSDAAEVTRYGTNAYPTQPHPTDTDQDGMPDGWEIQHARFSTTFRVWEPDPVRTDATEDPDQDGLANIAEYRNGTDPHDADTDGDGFLDGWEVRSGLDPNTADDPEADCDADGISNAREDELGTLACRTDSDNDGIPDPDEIAGEWTFDGQTYSFEPTEPSRASTGGTGAPDGWLVFHGLDPHARDHATSDPDADALATADEWTITQQAGLGAPTNWTEGLDPNTADSDGDELPDGWEVRVGLDPLDPGDGGVDTDGDGLPNPAEEAAGTSPTLPDTDGDGLSDGTEVTGWTITVNGEETTVRSNPLIRDTDSDGVPDQAERAGSFQDRSFPPTNPLSGDTDGDGLDDLAELTLLEAPALLDPTRDDTDGDGLLDGEEADYWNQLVERAATDPEYASLVRDEHGRSGFDVSTALAPEGDLDGDGTVNILDENSDDPGGLPNTEAEGLTDGQEVFPPARAGQTLPASDPSLRDSDGDTLPDSWEIKFTRYDAERSDWRLKPMASDSDGDGTPDNLEDMETGCYDDPSITGDGVPWWDAPYPNADELERRTDPLACDTDGDGLPDGWELAAAERMQSAGLDVRLNPTEGGADSDGDGTPDGAEISPLPVPSLDAVLFVDADACTPSDRPRSGKEVCLWRWSDADTSVEDRVPDETELLSECRIARCTVRVALNLTAEVEHATDPATADTDGDGFPDAWEILHRFDPTDASEPPLEDLDGDRVGERDEFEQGTDPLLADTDQGGIEDDVDINPLDPSDDEGDCDFDGLLDPDEARAGPTDPGNADTDGDGLLDASYTPDNCDGPRTPQIGTELIGVLDDPSDETTLVGESDGFSTKPGLWDTEFDGMPDGWELLYDLGPTTKDGGTDGDGDRLTNKEEYQLGRPTWWDEFEHGAWWFGSDPNTASSRDLDGDGLDDALFDPEPLSPSNDCSLPDGWSLPPAWSTTRCLASQPPTQAETSTLVKGLRQLAWEHVITQGGASEDARSSGDAPDRQTVRVTSLSHDPASLDTAEPFEVTANLCLVQGESCTTPDTPGKPLVGVYVVTRGTGAQPAPKQDPLLCVLDTGDDWTATGTCRMAPGPRSHPEGGNALVMALHKHGVLEPGKPWTVEPGDLEPGQSLALTAWPLPTRADDTLVVADPAYVNEPITRPFTPSGQAEIHLLGDPIVDAGEPASLNLRLTDTVGHPLPGRTATVTWNQDRERTLVTGDDGGFSFEGNPIDTEDPLSIPLEASFPTAGVIEGTQTTFDVPVRVPARVNATAENATAPGDLLVTAHLEELDGHPLTNRTLQVQAEVPGLAAPVSANGTTGPAGSARVRVPLPASANPGQAKVTVGFPGDARAGPANWQGLVDVRVRPELTIDVPDETTLTNGLRAVVGLRLPNGAPVTPAPGESLALNLTFGSHDLGREIANAPPGGRVPFSIPSGPSLPLGTSTLQVTLAEGRFNAPATNSTPVTVLTPVTAEVSPTVLGAGVENEVTVSLRDAVGRPVAGPNVTLSVLDVQAHAPAASNGNAIVDLAIPQTAPRGETTLQIDIESSGASLPLTDDATVTIRLGTRFDLPDTVSGSLSAYRLDGRLVTANDAPVSQVPLTVQALATHETVTDPEGRFALDAEPPEGARPGTHEAVVAFDGTDTLAPATQTVRLILLEPVNLTVDTPAPVALGSNAKVTGTVATSSGPVTEGGLEIDVGNRTYEAPVGPDGTFTFSVPVAEGSPRVVPAQVRFPGQGTYAAASAPVDLRVIHGAELTATQRVEDEGVTLVVQGVTGAGDPIARQTVLVDLPSGFVQVETDENGVAQYHVSRDALPAGTEVRFVYQGSDTVAADATSLTVQSASASVPGQPVGWIVVTAILVVEAVVLWQVYRRRRVLDRVLDSVQDLEKSLLAGNEVRAAVLHAYHRIQAALEAAGFDEQDFETHREYLRRTFDRLDASTTELADFMELVDRAQYDPDPIEANARTRALALSRGLITVLERTLPRRGAVP